MIPVGGAEWTPGEPCWGAGWGGDDKGASGSGTSGQLQIAQGHGSQKRKDFCKVQASLKTSHRRSSASRSLPDKCGLRGCSLLWKEASAPPGEPKSPWTERTPRDQSLPPPTFPSALSPLFLIRARVWLGGTASPLRGRQFTVMVLTLPMHVTRWRSC